MTCLMMPLLDEGTDVWRPVQAAPLGDGRFRILGPVPEGETWAFAPGAEVRAQERRFPDGLRLAAG